MKNKNFKIGDLVVYEINREMPYPSKTWEGVAAGHTYSIGIVIKDHDALRNEKQINLYEMCAVYDIRDSRTYVYRLENLRLLSG